MTWYKLTNDGEVLEAETVEGPGFSLDKDTPVGVDGWRRFNSLEEATVGLSLKSGSSDVSADSIAASADALKAAADALDATITGSTTGTLKASIDSVTSKAAESLRAAAQSLLQAADAMRTNL